LPIGNAFSHVVPDGLLYKVLIADCFVQSILLL